MTTSNTTVSPEQLKISKAEFQRMQKEIKRRNEQFAAANKKEKRVLIAQDVIKQLKKKKIKAATYIWMEIDGIENNHRSDQSPETVEDRYGVDAKTSFREYFMTSGRTCSCCALGSMFISCTLFNNKTTISDFAEESFSFYEYLDGSGLQLSNGLNRFFSRSQLRLIELMYESGVGNFLTHNKTEEKLVMLWRDMYPSDNDRLIAIMRNIIKHQGTFYPAKQKFPKHLRDYIEDELAIAYS